MEKLVDVMLYELSHIFKDPHDEAFQALWNDLREELVDQLVLWSHISDNKQPVREGFTSKSSLGQSSLSLRHHLEGCRISERGNEQTLAAACVPEQEGQNRGYIEAKNLHALTAGLGGSLKAPQLVEVKVYEKPVRRLQFGG